MLDAILSSPVELINLATPVESMRSLSEAQPVEITKFCVLLIPKSAVAAPLTRCDAAPR